MKAMRTAPSTVARPFQAVRRSTLHVAGMLAAQWQVVQTTVWQRVGHLWRHSVTSRGGWQGSQLMQVVYAVEQEYNLSKPFGPEQLTLAQRGVARICILGDQYLAASAKKLAGLWSPFKSQLGDSGHTVQDLKTRAFAPAWTTTR